MKKYARSNRKQQRLQERRNWTIRVNGRGEPRPYNAVQAEYKFFVEAARNAAAWSIGGVFV